MDSRNQKLSILWSGIALSLVVVSSTVQARDQGPSDPFAVDALNYIRSYAFPRQLKAPKDEILFKSPTARVAAPTETKAPTTSDVASPTPPTAAPVSNSDSSDVAAPPSEIRKSDEN